MSKRIERALVAALVLLWGCTLGAPPQDGPDTPIVVEPLPAPRLTEAAVQRLHARLGAPAEPSGMTVGAMLSVVAADIRAVADRVEPLHAGARARADSAVADIQYMLDRWTESPTVPPDYRADIVRSVEMLRLAREFEDPSDAYLVWDGVVEDIAIKAEHCRVLGIGLGGVVAVAAHTLRETVPDAGWQVVYLPKLFEVLPDAEPQPFPRLSSPAIDSLAPGRYWVWARRVGTTDRSERVLVKVGAGRTALDIDIPVPRGTAPSADDTVNVADTAARADGTGR